MSGTKATIGGQGGLKEQPPGAGAKDLGWARWLGMWKEGMEDPYLFSSTVL
jgi:hypothetical protein